MTNSKTIYNYGEDPHITYAQSEATKSAFRADESIRVSSSAGQDILSPYQRSQFDSLFDTDKRNISWAQIFSPEGFQGQFRRLFTESMLSTSLGSIDKQELQINRLTDYVEQLKKDIPDEALKLITSKKYNKKEYPQLDHDTIQLFLKASKEAPMIQKMLETMIQLQKDIEEVQKKRSQYNKG